MPDRGAESTQHYVRSVLLMYKCILKLYFIWQSRSCDGRGTALPHNINTMTQKGLLEWANYMRHSMVSDPGRKLFQEQVQTHGFSFLDDYLDNILSEVKQE